MTTSSATGQTAPTPSKVGAFTAPQPSKATVASSLASGNPVPEPTATGISINTSTGSVTASKPVEIPQVAWGKPEVAVKAKTSTKGGERAVVTYVEDGDGVFLKRGNGEVINCRVDGIDAPESPKKSGKMGQAYGEESKRTLQDLIDKKEVTLRIVRPADKGSNWGRALCQIEIEGTNISKYMAEKGAAWAYSEFVLDPEVMAAEKFAKENKLGLHAGVSPMKPTDFRKMLRQR